MLLNHSTHEKYKNYQLIILVNLSVIMWLINIISPDLFSPKFQFLFLLITVVGIGIPHGYFDFLIAKRLFSENKYWLVKFIFIYTFISIIYLTLWLYYPMLSLLIFLLLAIYHFGLEDSENVDKPNIIVLVALGSVPVISPILFHLNEVFMLFGILVNASMNVSDINSIYVLLYLSLIFGLIFIFSKKTLPLYVLLFLNFLFLPPIISFILYFCFHHSIRHYLSSLSDKNIISSDLPIMNLLIVLILFTIIFSLLVISFMMGTYNYSLEQVIIKYIFITLACLTLPHLLLNIIYEKTYKQL